MSGQGTANPSDKHNQPTPTGPATGQQSRDTEDRVGQYGGDDGALEHEQAEGAKPVSPAAEGTADKAEPGRKSGR